jgi:hypothetical protein
LLNSFSQRLEKQVAELLKASEEKDKKLSLLEAEVNLYTKFEGNNMGKMESEIKNDD